VLRAEQNRNCIPALVKGAYMHLQMESICAVDAHCCLSQVRINFPNGDMVGHTGKLEATITACTATDKAVKVVA